MTTTTLVPATDNHIAVTEYRTFNEAWNAATATQERFYLYSGLDRKFSFMREAQRWFVDGNGNLWISYLTSDKLRIVTQVSPHSTLTNAPFRYVQIMVPMSGKGTLRFTDTYNDRKDAIANSARAEVIAFNK